MRKGRKFAVALAAALFVSAVPTTAFGEVLYYTSGTSTSTSTSKATASKNEAASLVKTLLESGKMTVEEIQKLGPGYADVIKEVVKESSKELGVSVLEALEEESNAGFHGPTVTEVTLSQTYHDVYKTYELSMGNQFFLYSNIGNGGLTHEPVTIDIPANVAYTVEKDGLPYEYISKDYISGKGTYVMKLMGIVNKNAPLSEQQEYQAVFRFRIQDPPPADETEEAKASASISGSASIGTGNGSLEGNKEIPIIAPPKEEVKVETVPGTEPEKETAAEPETETPAETEAALETETAAQPSQQVEPKRTQKYERATGNYVITMENGMRLTSSVPEGYVGSDPVHLSVSEVDAVITKIYKNDELQEFVNDAAISDYGRYRVEMAGESYYFTLAYKVGQMDHYPVPTGMEFREVRLDEEVLTLDSNRYVEMKEDGKYTFTMYGDSGNKIETVLVKDTAAPEMNVSVSKSTAEIQYVSSDISEIVLIKDGKPVSDFRGTSISTPGKYTLTIYDEAGNSSSASFQLKYQINFYGVLAVVLVILSIAGAGAFVVYTKKNTKVR